MTSNAKTVNDYMESLPEDRKLPMQQLRDTILKNLPKGFEEGMQYGMISYFIPHTIYPAGYHCDARQPLPFVSIASQKNSINVYHMGIYMMPKLMNWYLGEYPKYIKTKPDMGKSCLRFKKIDNLPLELLGELMKQITVEEFIAQYEQNYKTSTR